MQFAGPMAPLAADRVALEDRRLITVGRARYRLGPVRVAEQASGHDRPVEVECLTFHILATDPTVAPGHTS